MVEVVGDSTRDGRWALVRLAVEGERIVGAEAEGLERPLDGLTPARGRGRRRRRARRGRAGERAGAGLPRRAEAGPCGRGDERRRRQRGRAAARRARTRSASPCASGSTRRGRTPSAPAARRRPCWRPARPATGSGCRTSRSTCARSSAARWSSRSCAATRPARRRTRASAATAASASPSCSRSPSAPAPERLATGHYARIVERDGRLLLARAADERKDQSYMLARLDPRFLDRLWFPLGEQGKDETRAEAARAGLEAAGRAESQEACFLAGGDYRDFLARHGLAAEDGPVVDEQGKELGRHAGFWRFTPGQRKGLGVAAGEPLYALAQRARDERGRRRAALRARNRRGDGARATARRARARRGEAALPLAGGRRERHEHRRRLSPAPRPARVRRRARARQRCSTTAMRWSARARSNLPKPSQPLARLDRGANDGRHDHADHSARAAVPRGRASRARRRRRAPEPDLREHRRSRDGARGRARAGLGGRRGDGRAAARRAARS